MIRPLRRLHRLMIAVLILVLAILFIAGLIVRKPIPANPQIPNTLLQTSSGGQR
ncbi:MAG: hypothetical protein AAB401_15050 [Acidobacteriota bacterium]